MTTVTTTHADRVHLAPAVRTLCGTSRRIAATGYRPVPWPMMLEGRTAYAGGFVLRAGIPAGARSSSRLTLSRHAGGFDSSPRSCCAALSTRPLLAAAALAERDGADADEYLDRAADLLAGLCLCTGATSAAFGAAPSDHGFGLTMPAISKRRLGRVLACFRIDRAAVEPRTGWVSAAQEALRIAALAYLADQYLAEAAEANRSPLDRARRVAAAARIAPTLVGTVTFGHDETADLLADYAATVAATDDGSEAWERFASASDRERDESDPANGNPHDEEQAEREAAESRARDGKHEVELSEKSDDIAARNRNGSAARKAEESGDDAAALSAVAGIAAQQPPREKGGSPSDAVSIAARSVTVSRIILAD